MTVYNYDRRGRGDSTDTAPYAVQREIEDLATVRAAVDGPAAVFGGSSGAMLALEAAAAGLDAERLVLWEPPCVVDDSRPPIPSGFAGELAAMIAAGRRGDAIEAYTVRGALLPVEAIAGLRQSPMWAATEALAQTLVHDAAIMDGAMAGRPLTGDRWLRATTPVLVLSGGASPRWMAAGAAQVAEVLPDARLRVLAGQAHNVEPQALAPALLEFLLGC